VTQTALMWFRNDLRVRDNPALLAARSAGPVIALYCLCPVQWRSHGMGPRRIAFILRNLRALSADLAARNIPLLVIQADKFSRLPALLLEVAQRHQAATLCFNDEYPVDEQRRDAAVSDAFERAGISVKRSSGSVLSPPGTVLTKAGKVATVYSAFRRRWLAQTQAGEWEPLPLVRRQDRPGQSGKTVQPSPIPALADIDEQLLSRYWPGGEAEARRRLSAFVDGPVLDYSRARDIPAEAGTSQLSPYLAVGALSPRQALAAALSRNSGRRTGGRPGVDGWINELLWREFYQHLTASLPRLSMGHSFKPETERLGWRDNTADLQAWQQGRTGYPLVDAGMRQLIATGWMHNRLRMLCAMFLSKHLLMDWRLGEAWFMQQLVDGDFAANNGGWQWSASTGCDAVPYFRIFNPVTQARRFDADGRFVRTWVPELADLQVPQIFEPWRVPLLAPAYAAPVVDHKAARERALAAFKALR
jgi:deoxyribodipyrimidine photo-lyase